MFYRIALILAAVAAIYGLYEIVATRLYYKSLQTAPADFMIMNKDTGTIPVIQFMDLNCADCKKANLLLMDYAEENPDISYMVRPVFSDDQGGREVVALLAAGLQGKYWGTIRLISGYNGTLDDKFFTDNAALADLDIQQLQKDRVNPEIIRIMEENALAAEKSGLKSTQALMVGEKMYYLASPLTKDDLEQMIQIERNQ